MGVPGPKLSRTRELRLGPLPVLQTFRDKEPFYRHSRIQKKERVIVLGPGVGTGCSDAPAFRSWKPTIEEHIQDFCSAGSSFLDNLGWDSRWFHRPEAARLGFSPWVLDPGRTFGDFRSGS